MSFLMHLSFPNLDIGWRSYELFLYLNPYIHDVLLSFLFFSKTPLNFFSSFFPKNKTPLTFYLFTFLPPLILDSFILCFFLSYLSIQPICHSFFLWTKMNFIVFISRVTFIVGSSKSYRVHSFLFNSRNKLELYLWQ